MKRFSGVLVFTVPFLLMAIFLAGAEQDAPPLSHQCLRPVWPSDFSSQSEVEKYNKEAEAYRNCIQQFVKEQHEVILRHQEAIQRHTQAAEAAIKEWNDFVESVESKQQSPKQ